MSSSESAAAALSDPALSLLDQLIRRRSITPDDAGCQEVIAERLNAAGFKCESMVFGEVTNLYARRGDSGPVLCFAGHTDVVPPGDGWDSDPFVPEIKSDRMIGRGAADMKSGVAAMVCALEAFVADQPDHQGSLAILLTSDEEGPATDGTVKVLEALSRRGEQIDWCVVGEPSCHAKLGDTLRIGRRGSMSGMLKVHGVQGHVAYPEQTDNPVTRFAPVLKTLCEEVWDNGNAYFPPTSFQVVDLQAGGAAVNVTPAELYARFNFRYCTEWTHESLARRVEEILDAANLDYELEWKLSGDPFLTEPGVFAEAAASAVQEITGVTPEHSTGGGTSDGRFFAPLGTEVVEFGPVNKTIHKINEEVLLEDVVTLSAVYRRIAEKLLT
ncbi:MAG: succinyl-diaminopimelate desuccinylase [Pseudomonadota bacterium]